MRRQERRSALPRARGVDTLGRHPGRPHAPLPQDLMATRKPASSPKPPSKNESLEPFRERPEDTVLTTDQGIPIPHTDDSLKASVRGPTLLEDFHFREKITRFDHERIPERVVHARGSAAHGYFQVYKSLEKYTQARFLTDP